MWFSYSFWHLGVGGPEKQDERHEKVIFSYLLYGLCQDRVKKPRLWQCLSLSLTKVYMYPEWKMLSWNKNKNWNWLIFGLSWTRPYSQYLKITFQTLFGRVWNFKMQWRTTFSVWFETFLKPKSMKMISEIDTVW